MLGYFRAVTLFTTLLLSLVFINACNNAASETDATNPPLVEGPDHIKPVPGSTACKTADNNDCPSWYANMPVSTWKAIGSNTFNDVGVSTQCSDLDPTTTCVQGSHNQGIISWSGAIAREDYLDIIAQGGGDKGSSDNGVYEFGPFTDEDPHWVRSYDPSQLNAADWALYNSQSTSYYPDGLPASRRGYEHQTFIKELIVDGIDYGNRWFAPWATHTYADPTAGSFREAASFAFTGQQTTGGHYEDKGAFIDFPAGINNQTVGSGAGFVIWDDTAKVVWAMAPNAPRELYAMDPVTRTWDGPYSKDLAYSIYTSSALDPVQRIIAVYEGTHAKLYIIDVTDDRDTQGGKLGNWVGAKPTGDFTVTSPNNSVSDGDKVSLEYEPVGGTFVGWSKITATEKQNLYTLKPTTDIRDPKGDLIEGVVWQWEAVDVRGDTPSYREKNGTFGRFQYISSIHALAVVNKADEPVYVFKLPADGL